MSKKRILLAVLALLCLVSKNSLYAQVWVGSLPLYYNPSFAGNIDKARISTYSNYQRGRAFYDPSTRLHNFSNSVNIDNYFSKISTGFGINLGQNFFQLGNNKDTRVNGYNIGLAIAPKISIKGKYTLSPGFDFSYSTAKILGIAVYPSPDGFERITSRASILFNSKKLYIGYTMQLFEKTTYLYKNQNPVILKPMYRSSFQAGYTFERSEDAEFSLTPQLVFHMNSYVGGIRYTADANITARYKSFLLGVGHIATHGTQGMIGVQKERFKLMYIQGGGLGIASRNTSYEGNLSLRFLLGK